MYVCLYIIQNRLPKRIIPEACKEGTRDQSRRFAALRYCFMRKEKQRLARIRILTRLNRTPTYPHKAGFPKITLPPPHLDCSPRVSNK
jgi:hypothetical protein